MENTNNCQKFEPLIEFTMNREPIIVSEHMDVGKNDYMNPNNFMAVRRNADGTIEVKPLNELTEDELKNAMIAWLRES